MTDAEVEKRVREVVVARFYSLAKVMFLSLCRDVPPSSEKKIRKRESLLPIFSEGGGTSVHKLIFLF